MKTISGSADPPSFIRTPASQPCCFYNVVADRCFNISSNTFLSGSDTLTWYGNSSSDHKPEPSQLLI